MLTVKVFHIRSLDVSLPNYQVYNKSVAEKIKYELEEMFNKEYFIEEREFQKTEK